MKRIGVTGATGFVGRALVRALAERGDRVRALVRDPAKAQAVGAFPAGVEVRALDLERPDVETAQRAAALHGLDAVVHLAGETVAGRWTAEKKRRIHESREITTRNLVTAMWSAQGEGQTGGSDKAAPHVLICASASGYYGSRGDEPLDESAAPGNDFLARVCVDWEREAHVAEDFGVRVVCLRQGIVLGRNGGALQAMLPIFRAGLGGPLGSGRQWWPWIHLDDDVALFMFALDREDLRGAVNAVAPDPATNARLSQALAHALHRFSLLPAPAPAVRLVLGEFAQSLLSSQLLLPAAAQDAGFVWRHPTLEEALLDLFDARGGQAPATHVAQDSIEVAAPLEKVFDFFSRAENLEQLTPPEMRLKVLTRLPIAMRRGTIIEYNVRTMGLPVRWKTLITMWDPPHGFEDVQLRGPFLLFRHRHRFTPAGAKTVVSDHITYNLGLDPLSRPALPLVRRNLDRLLAYRRSRLPGVL